MTKNGSPRGLDASEFFEFVVVLGVLVRGEACTWQQNRDEQKKEGQHGGGKIAGRGRGTEQGAEWHDTVQLEHEEKQRRLEVYRKNVELIEEFNSGGHSYTLTDNKFADLTNEEFRAKVLGLGAPGRAGRRAPRTENFAPVSG